MICKTHISNSKNILPCILGNSDNTERVFMIFDVQITKVTSVYRDRV